MKLSDLSRATEDRLGKVEKATTQEAIDAVVGKYPDAAGVKAHVDSAVVAHKNEADPHTQYLQEAKNLSDINSPATAFGNIKQAATTTSTGVIEKATTAEAEAGTADKFPDAATMQIAGDNRYEPRHSANMAWDSTSDTYSRYQVTTGITPIHERMRRCIVNDAGEVVYYLDPNDSTLKADGTVANLDGTDGQVMVEIPKFYVRISELFNGEVKREISEVPRSGFVLHPAFAIGGVLQYDSTVGMWHYKGHTSERGATYIGAYQASVYDVSAATHIDGLNLNDNSANVDTVTDTLASVSGYYPMVGLTRTQFRSLASNKGSGWSQWAFWQLQAVKLLFFVEYGGFNSQALLANGNVSVSTGYPTSSSNQTDSPHSFAGKSNSIGNGSGGVDSTTRDTAWMSYRGIENLWGNAWQWCDGWNINDRVWYVTSEITSFADDTTTGYSQLGVQAPVSSGYIRNVQHYTLGDVISDNTGNSSTAFADYYYQSTGWNVAGVGGSATNGANAGVGCAGLYGSSASSNRSFSSRLSFNPE